MPKTSSRKRKADRSDDTDTDNCKRPARENTTPHLPPPVWGHVLDYMPYSEVRSALLVGKEIANEAVKYVKTLNVLKDCELDVPAARRFPMVEELNILCLLKKELDIRGWDKIFVLPHVAISIPHFVREFRGLKNLYFGGIRPSSDKRPGTKFFYKPLLHCEPENHAELYRSLIASLLGAYNTRALSQNVTLHDGTLDGLSEIRKPLCYLAEDSDDERCEWCENLCKFLPLQHHELFRDEWLCLDDETRNGILRARQGGPELIKSMLCNDIVIALERSIRYHAVENDTEEEREYWQKLRSYGVSSEIADVIFFDETDLEDVDQMLHSLGLKPNDIPKEILYEKLNIGQHDREYDVWIKSSVERFVTRGYPLDPGDLVVLDETEEPLLHELNADY